MIKFSVFLLLGVLLNASIVNDYINKQYNKVCTYKNIFKYRKNEQILSLIGESCVKSNNLYLIPYIVRHLRATKVGRRNAIYFLIIYNEKKLLYAFLFDGFDIKNFSFPYTKNILSDVFMAIKNGNYEEIGNLYIIKKNDFIIKMYKENDKMIIEKYKKNKLIKRQWYK